MTGLGYPGAAQRPSGLAVVGGEHHLDLDGVSGSFVSTSDHPDFDVNGDLEIRIRIAAASDSAVRGSTLVDRQSGVGGFHLFIRDSSAQFALLWGDGVTTQSLLNLGAPGLSPWRPRWFAFRLDVAAGLSNRCDALFSDDDTSDHTEPAWSALASLSDTGTSMIASSNVGMQIGEQRNGAGSFPGRVYAVAVLDGIGGTVVTAPVFADAPVAATSYTDPQGHVWTPQGDARIAAGAPPLAA